MVGCFLFFKKCTFYLLLLYLLLINFDSTMLLNEFLIWDGDYSCYGSFFLFLICFLSLCSLVFATVECAGFLLHCLYSLYFVLMLSEVNDGALLCALMIVRCVCKRGETLVHTQCLS